MTEKELIERLREINFELIEADYFETRKLNSEVIKIYHELENHYDLTPEDIDNLTEIGNEFV